MDLKQIVIYVVVALVVMVILPKLGIRTRGGNSPLNPPGRNPGGGGGGGIFPNPGAPSEPTPDPGTRSHVRRTGPKPPAISRTASRATGRRSRPDRVTGRNWRV